jgi:hypothetical protein
VPPSRIHVFHSYTLEEFQAQNLLPWRIPNSKPFIPEKFQALKNSNLKTLYPEEFHEEFQAQIPLPLKNSNLKTLYAAWKNSTLETLLPRRIPSSKPFSHDEFHAQNPSPMTNSMLKTLYPWRIPGILDRGLGVRILNGIAQLFLLLHEWKHSFILCYLIPK